MSKGLPRPGEIIAIKRENGLIVHRLSKIINKSGSVSYIARGDSNAYADNPVKIDKIAGRIVRAETTGENPVPADIRINTKPNYFVNRIRVIGILLWKKIKILLHSFAHTAKGHENWPPTPQRWAKTSSN